MIDLYHPPRPAIILPGEPWQREINRKLIAMGLGIAQRQAVVHALKALQHDRNRSSILKPTLDELAKYSRADAADLATLVPGIGASGAVAAAGGTGSAPTVRTSQGGFNNSAVASNSITLPGTTATGDRVIIIYALQSNATATITHPSGWNVGVNNRQNGASQGATSVVWKDVTMPTDDGPTFGVSSSTWRVAWVVIVLTGGSFSAIENPVFSSVADGGSSTSVDPPNITAQPWNPFQTLLLAGGAWSHNIAVSVEPTNFTNLATGMGTTATGATVTASKYGVSFLGGAADPSAYTIASASRSVAITMSVKGV